MNERRTQEQEKLREDIMAALHAETQHLPEAVQNGLYRDLSVCIIYNLDRRHPISHEFDSRCLFANIVAPRIREFTKDNKGEEERRFLMCELLDRVSQVATRDFRRAYLNPPQPVAA